MAQTINEKKPKALEVEQCRDKNGEGKANWEKANWHEQKEN
jgi:hypothetical protein